MYLLDNCIEVDSEVQSRPVDDVDEVTQRIGYTLKVRCFYRRSSCASSSMNSHLRMAPGTATAGRVRMAAPTCS
jgi:hypothetical protein